VRSDRQMRSQQVRASYGVFNLSVRVLIHPYIRVCSVRLSVLNNSNGGVSRHVLRSRWAVAAGAGTAGSSVVALSRFHL
jgi:hypothetical protein